MAERIILIGNATETRIQDICPFVKTVHCSYGGSFLSRKEGLPDTIIKEEAGKLLTEAGIPDPSPLVVCDSDQERAEQILQVCNSRRKQCGEGLYLVIDQDPFSLAEAVKCAVGNDNRYPPEILKSMTMIKLGAKRGTDHVDQATGLRVTILPYPLSPFPTHPTPTF